MKWENITDKTDCYKACQMSNQYGLQIRKEAIPTNSF